MARRNPCPMLERLSPRPLRRSLELTGALLAAAAFVLLLGGLLGCATFAVWLTLGGW